MTDLNKLKERNKIWLRDIGRSLKLASRDEITAAKLIEVGNDLTRIQIDLDKQPPEVFTAAMDKALIKFKSEAFGLADDAEKIKTNLFEGNFYERVMNLGRKLISFSASIPSYWLPIVALDKIEFVEKLLDSLN